MLNMMEDDCACDQPFVASMLAHYGALDQHTVIPAHESDRVLARAMHHHAEAELQWIGGEQKVERLVATLKSLKH